MAKAGSTVIFNDATAGRYVEAEVLSVNEDGSLNIAYPHPVDPSARATADCVQAGAGAWRWQPNTKAVRQAIEEEALASAPPENPTSAETSTSSEGEGEEDEGGEEGTPPETQEEAPPAAETQTDGGETSTNGDEESTESAAGVKITRKVTSRRSKTNPVDAP